MPTFIPPIAITLIGIALIYGAYTDFKQRIIPNKVPLSIFVLGIFTATPLLTKIVHFGLMVLLLVVLSLLTKSKSGGGDIKVYCALSFAIGLVSVVLVLAATILLATIVNRIQRKKKLDKKERIPLCTFLAPAYLLTVWVPTIVGCFI